MKESPIIMSQPMMKAYLDGRKTQTRRLKGLEMINKNPDDWTFVGFGTNPDKESDKRMYAYFKTGYDTWMYILCPYGYIGDILWVRETFCPVTIGYAYKADGVYIESPAWIWKPSIFMPKEACRIRLLITNVKVERLQEISKKDAIAEGIEKRNIYNINAFRIYGSPKLDNGQELQSYDENPINSYWSLWDSINGKVNDWLSNPFIFVYEFEKYKS